MKIAVCDDNKECISILESHLKKMNVSIPDCDIYQSGESLLSFCRKHNKYYDVIFLDMEMKQLNGIETATHIREIDENVIIVFVTAHSEYMKESFKCQPFRFLLKPIDFDEFKATVEDILKKLSKRKKVFSFSENKTKVRLYCDDIIYCESHGHWIWIHTKDNSYKLLKSMSELHEQLDKETLFRVHKSFIVNFRYLKIIRENNIELYHCDALIPISRSYKKTTIEEYTNFVERNTYL